MATRFYSPVVLQLLLVALAPAAAADNSAEGIELFEKQIRPLLVETCWQCHAAKEQEAGLRLDSRDAMLRGGQTGAAIVPGDPEKSLLIEAVGYQNPDFQMPPDGRLGADRLSALQRWIRLGAPWPNEQIAESNISSIGFQITDEQRQHWALHPVPPAAVPKSRDSRWSSGPIDQFIQWPRPQSVRLHDLGSGGWISTGHSIWSNG